jgi:pyruvate/2-oxoglutarate dehydrogenase complex dihydrolipoamide dehydrogenase (E3) component
MAFAMKRPRRNAAGSSRAPARAGRAATGRRHAPAPLRYDLAIIGAGPAGLAAAVAAAHSGYRVALFEHGRLGGTSLNSGSVPSKALIRSATLFAAIRECIHLQGSGLTEPVADLARVATRLRKIEERIAGYHSLARLRRLGIDVHFVTAKFLDRTTLVTAVGHVKFKKALLATGAAPAPADIPGLTEGSYVTSESIFGLTQLPARLAVIGGGPLGCELAQAFCRLGSEVTIIQDEAKFLPKEERDAAQILSRAMARDGVNILLNTRVVRARAAATKVLLETENYKTRATVAAECVLLSVGRIPNVRHLNLEAAGIAFDSVRGIVVDAYLRTSNPQVYAAGDVCMAHKYTHVAESSGRMAVLNALQRAHLRHSELIIPWCTYCAPEVAHVGLQVWEARERSIPVKTYTILMQDVDRAITDRQDTGFVKLHVSEGGDRILGATIVASRASEMINEVCVAMHSRIGLRALAQVIHTYPSQSGAIRLAALCCEASD